MVGIHPIKSSTLFKTRIGSTLSFSGRRIGALIAEIQFFENQSIIFSDFFTYRCLSTFLGRIAYPLVIRARLAKKFVKFPVFDGCGFYRSPSERGERAAQSWTSFKKT